MGDIMGSESVKTMTEVFYGDWVIHVWEEQESKF